MINCQICGGSGSVFYSVPTYRTATRDMAIDACDRSLEGQEIQWDDEEVEEPCQACNGIGKVMMKL